MLVDVDSTIAAKKLQDVAMTNGGLSRYNNSFVIITIHLLI
jgi:hypothetical protein